MVLIINLTLTGYMLILLRVTVGGRAIEQKTHLFISITSVVRRWYLSFVLQQAPAAAT